MIAIEFNNTLSFTNFNNLTKKNHQQRELKVLICAHFYLTDKFYYLFRLLSINTLQSIFLFKLSRSYGKKNILNLSLKKLAL